LAGLLSDDEDSVAKSKAKKTQSTKRTPAKKEPEPATPPMTGLLRFIAPGILNIIGIEHNIKGPVDD
jgi:hypothetical protein